MRFASHISGFLAASLLFWLISLIQQDHPVLSYDRHYSANTVYAGQQVMVSSDVERSDSCSSTIQRTWIDQNGNVLLVTTEERVWLEAGHEPYKTEVQIPVNAEPGVLRQRVKTIFYCNWLQSLLNIGSEFVMTDVIFTVSKKDP